MDKRTGIKDWMREAYKAGDMDKLEGQPADVLRKLAEGGSSAPKKSKSKAKAKKDEDA